MIKIEHPNIDKICLQYAKKILSCPRRIKSNRYVKYLFEKDRLLNVICCPPEKLSEVISDFDNQFPNKKGTEWDAFRTYMINQYNSVRKKYLPQIIEDLGLTVCPYCNRHYIYTVEKGRKVGAQFDHFFSKSKYPYLALSFYNLIPCCPSCNKAKGDQDILVNPYLEGFNSKCVINIDNPINCILGNDEWAIELKGTKETVSNITAFALDELYKKHRDIAQEIVYKSVANSNGFLSEIKKEFKYLELDDELIHRIIWGYYYNENDMSKRPLSKMAFDIITQIDDIYQTN